MKKKNIKSQAVVAYKTPLQKLQIYKLKKEVSLLKKSIEKKALQYSFLTSQVDSTGTSASLMLNIPQGLQYDERIGMSVSPRSILMIVTIYPNTNTITGSGAFNLILDKQPNGILPTPLTIFTNVEPEKLLFQPYKKRFKNLKEWHFDYNTTANGGGDSPQTLKFYLDLSKYGPTQYSGASANITSLANGRNDYIITFRSTNTATGSVSYGVRASLRMIYTDS